MPKPTTKPPTTTGATGTSKRTWSSPRFIVLQFLMCAACLSFGFLVGMNYGFQGCHQQQNLDTPMLMSEQECELLSRKLSNRSVSPEETGDRFPINVHHILEGMAFIDRDAFTKRFDMGVPLDDSTPQNDKVLMLYNHPAALPHDSRVQTFKAGEIPTLQVHRGVKNCDVMNVLLLQQNRPKQCTAIVGQYPSYHVHKWMRLPVYADGDYGPLDSDEPLVLVNRGAQQSGRKSTSVPSLAETNKYWTMLKTYLETLPKVLEELKPLAAKVAKKNTVVVMLCNHGQSELLINFVCSARSRNLDLSPVLLFATDEETKVLGEGLGLTVFFDKTNYGSAPNRAAGRYGDAAFTAMMMAKVYCVQMVSNLGYDILFQDVDIVWYQDPLQYFHDRSAPSHDFDIYFQDDGNRAIFYAPYSANSGFYYVRANDLTRYFFNSLLMSGDLIFTTNSHQIALVAILAEYASRYGMKAKIIPKEANEFLCGEAFHNRKDVMKALVKGEVHPYLFHMSWTENKVNKKIYFEQLGEWYVNEKCVESTADKILGHSDTVTPGSLLAACCAAEAIFICHYKDKPSREPCPDAPFIDPAKGKSFW